MTHHPVPPGDHGSSPGRDRPLPAGRPSAAPSLLAAALRAAAAGWVVFPVRPRGKVPAVRDWERAATTDPARLAGWWFASGWNIGVAAGRSGLLVVDLDTPGSAGPRPVGSRWLHDPDAAAVDEANDDGNGRGRDDDCGAGTGATSTGTVSGWDVLRRLAAEAGESPPGNTFTVATPSGGRHLYFRQPDGARLRNTQGALGRWIDTRGHGGYVLAAGSRGPARGRYRIVRDVPVAPLPGWLMRALTTPPPAALTSTALPVAGGPWPVSVAVADDEAGTGRAGIEVPVVSAARLSAYLRAVVDGEAAVVTAAAVGTRHTTLLRAARRLGQWVGGGALSWNEAHAVLTVAARGYVGVDGYTAGQVERDIADGLRFGAARPRYIDDLPDRPVGSAPDRGR